MGGRRSGMVTFSAGIRSGDLAGWYSGRAFFSTAAPGIAGTFWTGGVSTGCPGSLGAWGGLAVRRGQERVHLRFVQIGDDGLAGLLEWDGTDLATPGDVFRTVLPHETRQRVPARDHQRRPGNDGLRVALQSLPSVLA